VKRTDSRLNRNIWALLVSYGAGFKKITGLAIPIALSYTFSFSVVIIGLLANPLYTDAQTSAAMTLVMSSINSLTIIFISPLFALSIIASRLQGSLRQVTDQQHLEKIKNRISAVNIKGMFICFSLFPALFLILFFSKWVFYTLLGQPKMVSFIAQDFLRIYAFAAPVLLLRICYEQMMFSFSKAKPAMVMGLVSLTFGTLLAFLFSRGWFFIPKMGLKGIALGYVVEAYLIAIFYGCYIQFSKAFDGCHFFRFKLSTHAGLNLMKEIRKIAVPISFVVCNEVILTFAISTAGGIAGITSLAALNISMTFVFFCFVFLAAFGQSCCQEVSRQLGAKDFKKARYLSISGALASVVVIGLFASVVIVYPSLFSNLINGHDPHVVSTALYVLPIISLTTIFDSLRYHLLQVLRAYHDLIKPMILSTSSTWVTIFFLFFIGVKLNYQAKGIAWVYLIGTIMSVLLLLPRYIKKINALYLEA
jgi:MATE family multidrug resistance protein